MQASELVVHVDGPSWCCVSMAGAVAWRRVCVCVCGRVFVQPSQSLPSCQKPAGQSTPLLTLPLPMPPDHNAHTPSPLSPAIVLPCPPHTILEDSKAEALKRHQASKHNKAPRCQKTFRIPHQDSNQHLNCPFCLINLHHKYTPGYLNRACESESASPIYLHRIDNSHNLHPRTPIAHLHQNNKISNLQPRICIAHVAKSCLS